MKRLVTLFVALAMILCFVSSAVSGGLDQHNYAVDVDSIPVIAGQTTDTSSTFSSGLFSEFTLFSAVLNNSAEDSASVLVILQGSVDNVNFIGIDSLVCDSVVANLPTYNWADADATVSDWLYVRILSVCKNGTNDTVTVVNRLFKKE